MFSKICAFDCFYLSDLRKNLYAACAHHRRAIFECFFKFDLNFWNYCLSDTAKNFWIEKAKMTEGMYAREYAPNFFYWDVVNDGVIFFFFQAKNLQNILLASHKKKKIISTLWEQCRTDKKCHWRITRLCIDAVFAPHPCAVFYPTCLKNEISPT